MERNVLGKSRGHGRFVWYDCDCAVLYAFSIFYFLEVWLKDLSGGYFAGDCVLIISSMSLIKKNKIKAKFKSILRRAS